ncbi:hypothetical protein D1815_04980 [Aquimarina sp. AD1]|uniref:hypothetical protein n=1 Tax=Aquimarina TaxID=290174 RepID=UPI0004046302|nr:MULTISPECIES: hypothetical protein [Aquimarina]AXT55140.1 hypothetical protein D1815_04980 [Aquimarina sp. AD1]RKN06751.1 hypothetical protein D7035_20865 [Aquimarina sp. AD1]
MKEENVKKILEKSTVETSDDFINKLMKKVDVQQNTKKSSFWSFKIVIVACSILLFIAIGSLHNFPEHNFSMFGSFFNNIPKTPFFLMIIITILCFMNSIIRLNYFNEKQN